MIQIMTTTYFLSSYFLFKKTEIHARSWKSLEAVRKGHLMASKYADKNKSGFISQRDMALTQFGFMGFILLKPHKLGIQLGKKMSRHSFTFGVLLAIWSAFRIVLIYALIRIVQQDYA